MCLKNVSNAQVVDIKRLARNLLGTNDIKSVLIQELSPNGNLLSVEQKNRLGWI